MKLILTILIFGMMFLPIIFLIDEMYDDMCAKQPKKKKYNIQDEMNMLDEAKWVEKVIESCKTYKQLIAADELRSILWDKYHDKVDTKLLNKVSTKLYWDWEKMADIVSYG